MRKNNLARANSGGAEIRPGERLEGRSFFCPGAPARGVRQRAPPATKPEGEAGEFSACKTGCTQIVSAFGCQYL